MGEIDDLNKKIEISKNFGSNQSLNIHYYSQIAVKSDIWANSTTLRLGKIPIRCSTQMVLCTVRKMGSIEPIELTLCTF